MPSEQDSTRVTRGEAVKTGDATVISLQENNGSLYGKTLDCDGSEFVWVFDGVDVDWITKPNYYLQTKTENALCG